MLLGQKVKEAIEQSEFSTEDVAAFIGISHTNLYRIYKKDSFEVKYLLKIAEKLNLPLGHFLNDETIGAILHNESGQANFAHKVGTNQQNISVGMGSDECIQKLEALQREYALQQQLLAEKERTIEILINQR